jgi:hypothetical protein
LNYDFAKEFPLKRQENIRPRSHPENQTLAGKNQR